MATNDDGPSESLDKQFRHAIKNFEASAKLTNSEQRDYRNMTLEKFNMAMASLQREQAQKRQLLFMRRLEPFIETIQAYGKAIDVFANASEILSFIWGPMRVILVISSNLSEAFSSVLDAYEQIADQMPILSTYHILHKDRPYLRPLLVRIFEDILDFHLTAVRFFNQKVWRHIFNAWSRRFLVLVKNLKDNIGRHYRLIQHRATLSEYEDAQRSREKADLDLDELRSASLSQRRDAVLNWLSPAQLDEVHERHIAARSDTPNAGSWLLEHKAMKEWLYPSRGSTPLLWLKGKPGAGKTILASIVIEHLRLQDTSVVFFYISNSDPARADFLSIARGILSQLVALSTKDDDLVAYLDDERLKTSSAKLNSLKLAKSLLHVAFKTMNTVIVLDGIDELPSREQRKDVCSWFYTLVDLQEDKVKAGIRCLFISQDDSFARRDLEHVTSLEIYDNSNQSDIKAFADIWQERIVQKFGSFRELCSISHMITAKSRGMFIYAKCLLMEMFEVPSREELIRSWSAEQLPQELDELYQRILNRLVGNGPQSRLDITRRLLSWLCVARRPLHWHEIQGAISIDVLNMCLSAHNRCLLGGPKDFCGSLIELNSDGIVQLVHPTLKSFLITRSDISLASAHYELCSLSVTYLQLDFINSDLDTADIDNDVLEGSYSFLDYAMSCWVYHLMDWLPESQPQQTKLLAMSLALMLDQHLATPIRAQPVAKSLRKTLQPLKSSACYDELSQAIVWTRKIFASSETQTQVDLLDLRDIITAVRRRIEWLSRSSESEQQSRQLEEYYGENVFKCSRFWCSFSYTGFRSSKSRDAHIQRHDQPFLCYFEDCTNATFSCASKKELSAHLFECHNIAQKVDEFPKVSKPSIREAHQGGRKEQTEYACTECNRVFTRKHLLREHLGEHPGQLPYFCDCSKAFATSSEEKNHRKMEHFDGEWFICQGYLESSGERWGCNCKLQSFELLKDHWKEQECLPKGMQVRLREHIALALVIFGDITPS